MTLVSFAERPSVQLVTSSSEALLSNPEHEDRTESDAYVRIYIYIHTNTYILMALLYDTMEKNKRKRIQEIKKEKIS